MAGFLPFSVLRLSGRRTLFYGTGGLNPRFDAGDHLTASFRNDLLDLLGARTPLRIHDNLAKKRADALITHEAPDCHRYV